MNRADEQLDWSQWLDFFRNHTVYASDTVLHAMIIEINTELENRKTAEEDNADK